MFKPKQRDPHKFESCVRAPHPSWQKIGKMGKKSTVPLSSLFYYTEGSDNFPKSKWFMVNDEKLYQWIYHLFPHFFNWWWGSKVTRHSFQWMVSVRNKTTSIELIQKFTWQTCDAQHPIHQSAKKMEKIVIIVPFVLLLSQSGCGRVMSEKTHRTGRTHHFLGAWYHFPSHHYLMSFGSSCRPHRRSPPPPHRLVVVYLGIWKRERDYTARPAYNLAFCGGQTPLINSNGCHNNFGHYGRIRLMSYYNSSLLGWLSESEPFPFL